MLPVSPYLNWRERPHAMNAAISTAFEWMPKQDCSEWGVFNGSSLYNMCGVNEHHLMKALIQESYPHRKLFYAMELGAGNFQWLEGLSAFIEEQKDLPSDIEVHIIGVRGESYNKEQLTKVGRCHLYRLGAFKVEELFTQFQKRGLCLENKVDLGLSSWCFRHLVNPVRTFAQMILLIRPTTGCFIGDGFFFLEEGCRDDTGKSNLKMAQLLMDTKASFLMEQYDDTRSLNRFILRRSDEGPLQLPMQYLGVHSKGRDDAASMPDFQTKFRRTLGNRCTTIELPQPRQLSGEKKLFDFLYVSGCFRTEPRRWTCIRRDDCLPEAPLLHQAIRRSDIEAVVLCLKKGDDGNALDSRNCSPLDLAISWENHEIFTLLLNYGAKITFSTREADTPLHTAAAVDEKGAFLLELIARGADINCRDWYRMTPLSCAIQAKNTKAVEILLQKGAECSAQDRKKLLKKKKFSVLCQQGLLLDRK